MTRISCLKVSNIAGSSFLVAKGVLVAEVRALVLAAIVSFIILASACLALV
jgi:hypothetical protein